MSGTGIAKLLQPLLKAMISVISVVCYRDQSVFIGLVGRVISCSLLKLAILG